jgi:hypothetical protein
LEPSASGAAAGALNATRHGLGSGTRAQIEQISRAVRRPKRSRRSSSNEMARAVAEPRCSRSSGRSTRRRGCWSKAARSSSIGCGCSRGCPSGGARRWPCDRRALGVLVLEALWCEDPGPLVDLHHMLCVLRLEGGRRSLSGEIVHVPTVRPAIPTRIRRTPRARRAVLPMLRRDPWGQPRHATEIRSSPAVALRFRPDSRPPPGA